MKYLTLDSIDALDDEQLDCVFSKSSEGEGYPSHTTCLGIYI